MRLAHFIQRYPPALGGSEAYFARLSRYCAARGDEVTVYTTTARSVEAFWSPTATTLPEGVVEEAGVQVRRYPLWRMHGRRWLLKPLSFFPSPLWQCLTLPCNPIAWGMWRDANHERVEYDAVHASAFPYAWPIACAWRLARRLKIPFLLTPFLHLGDPANPRDLTRRGSTSRPLRWLLQQAEIVFVQTPSEQAAARELGVPADKIVLQGMGVEPNECTGGDRLAARQRWRVPPDALVVGHLANQSWEKGTNDLLAALQPLWQKRQPIYLLLAGPQMPNFERFWKNFPQRDWVRQLGPLTEADKRDFYASLDVFALPSRSDSFGLVLLEAWANRVPNVAYRAGGVGDVIRHGEDGLLVSCGDIDALTQALQRVCAERELRERLEEAGRARVEVEFRWEEKLRLVRDHYDA